MRVKLKDNKGPARHVELKPDELTIETPPTEDKKKHAGGRPLLFKSVKELEEKIEEYFYDCDNRTRTVQEVVKGKVIEIEVANPRPYTLSGLAVALDCDRHTLVNYGRREEFFTTVSRARAKCHNFAEESLWTPKIASGIAFVLKNGFGWKDQTEMDVTSKGESVQVYLPKRNEK